MPYYTIQPATADVRNKQNDASSNFGSENPLYCKSYDGEESKVFLTWDLSSTPLSGSWLSCTLYLYCTGSDGAISRNQQVHRITSVWAEASLTWNSSPSVSATQAWTGGASASTSAWHSFSLGIAEAKLMRDSNYGLRLSWTANGATEQTLHYAPRDYATASLRPYLYIKTSSAGSPMWWS